MSPSGERPVAVVLANGLLTRRNGKTTHGLLRGPSRYRIKAVVDPDHAGRDAGEVALGRAAGVPVVADMAAALALPGEAPGFCVVGVATPGGYLPPGLRADLLAAAGAGLTLVNGMHHTLADDAEIVARAGAAGGGILDIRRPRPASELRFWSGEVDAIRALRVAVLGTDCAVGKRTTAVLLREACRARGLRAEMIYTGQTGWLQGIPHGFIFDATPNDFVCGELEGALLACARDGDPDVILMEGQSGLRNPSGPCGSEWILSGSAHGVVLQHPPGRRYYEGLERLKREIRPLAEEIELIRLLGAPVWAVTLCEEGLDDSGAETARRQLSDELGMAVIRPLKDGLDGLAEIVAGHVASRPDRETP